MSSIKNDDDFELRKALRNHNIDTIVLASPGVRRRLLNFILDLLIAIILGRR